MCSADIFLGLLAILFPPLPVWVKRGLCSADSLINILLCILGYLPGLIHSWYIIARFPEEQYEYERGYNRDAERVTYVFVAANGENQNSRGPARQPRPSANKSGAGPTYGTTNNATNNQASNSRPPQQTNAGEGGSDGAAPPSYAQVVAGDNKIQTQD
ncbi:hypothetical protein MCOR27_002463 [Pyricularia oryzae]|uniref:Stress response RCI peptide n=4 Tax=Pyricularia TaxID=48558 RepID=A0ABQ8NR62_PYRGI|nr:uncharacterized protein MGG_08808 [Pyricularia oryzae 70-15]ELQ32696.1 hypothetical protein OOU_Y34scaffold01073g14 [Pyricularia oryzae Y34]KAH8845351.1 hypothetical protein MCOR01_002595 [Pyricularia oryzae]KAI6300933.1 hypothetical protein MCOR33_003415 [Pyricularia grisea]EHA46796.1 hypothetical protein MGG_08808 [Pyricularia oryzae 70-15]KAI6285095.1 hypothetical protein MCOR27_002463 [Pyricularia oryzae]